MTVLDLFSGIGGFSLGLERTGGFRTVAFCETDPFCQKVLTKHWLEVPCYGDIKTLTGERLRADGIIPDIITGGPPCQPASLAGQRRGEADDRWLWPEALRLVAEVRPRWAVFENPYGILALKQGVVFERLCAEMESQGYTVQTFVIPACGIGAPHRRNRVWIMAHTEKPGRQTFPTDRLGNRASRPLHATCSGNVAYADEQHGNRGRYDPGEVRGEWSVQAHLQGSENMGNTIGARWENIQGQCPPSESPGGKEFGTTNWWNSEPAVGRVAHGIPRRVDRLRGLGNAVVPQLITMLGYAILETEYGKVSV